VKPSKLDEGKASIQALDGKVTGELRVSAPSDLGRNILLEWIDEIMDEHPDLSINLMLGDSIADFYLDKVDLAIRYGNQEDSSMVAFKLATIDRILCASPSYIVTNGMPQQPHDLLQHECLLLHMNNRVENLWEFISKTHNNEKIKLRVSSKRSANDADIVRR
jgi:DNA-binding transcriptional LysR family regulator